MRYCLGLLFCICCTLGYAQDEYSGGVPNQEMAEAFVEQLRVLLAEERVDDFISEFVVTESELRTFLTSEWERTLSKRLRKKLHDLFEPGLQNAWQQIQRDNGYYVGHGFIGNKNMLSDEKKVRTFMLKAEFSAVSLTTSETYDKHYGEISHYRLYLISTRFITDTDANPVFEFDLWLPCIFTAEGKFKLVAPAKAELVSRKFVKE